MKMRLNANDLKGKRAMQIKKNRKTSKRMYFIYS